MSTSAVGPGTGRGMRGRQDGGGSGGGAAVRTRPEAVTAHALVAAVRPRFLDPDAQERALAAFRQARTASSARVFRPTRTHRAERDDWSPRAGRGTRRMSPSSLAGLLGGAALVASALRGAARRRRGGRRPVRH
ncbi:hypothetical protein AB0C59_00225 [Streptomyces sp. NPDC048664]|uniref:hypothetical protein n=1 Tax=Streptomyces sp. NPDC048664 TaxID=3154505 RepID=UPI0034122567